MATAKEKAEREAAVQRLRQARRELEEFGEREIAKWGKGNCPESEEYHRLSDAVADAEKNAVDKRVPWWGRF